jgi:hypothetical protein
MTGHPSIFEAVIASTGSRECAHGNRLSETIPLSSFALMDGLLRVARNDGVQIPSVNPLLTIHTAKIAG